jgi:hypothetical protein
MVQSEGVKVTHRRYDGMIHAFIGFLGVIGQAHEAMYYACSWLKDLFSVKISEKREKGRKMKIKVESEKIIKAMKKLDGIEIVLENPTDAKEAIDIILRKVDRFQKQDFQKLKDVKVTSFQRYETSAVDYKMIFLLEFMFEEDISPDIKLALIKELQDFFNAT